MSVLGRAMFGTGVAVLLAGMWVLSEEAARTAQVGPGPGWEPALRGEACPSACWPWECWLMAMLHGWRSGRPAGMAGEHPPCQQCCCG